MQKLIDAGYKFINGCYQKDDGDFKHTFEIVPENKRLYVMARMRTDYKNKAIPLSLSVSEFNDLDILQTESKHKDRLASK